RKKEYLALSNCVFQRRAKRQSAFSQSLSNKVFQTWLVDDGISLGKSIDLSGILVHADDGVSRRGEASARNRSNITRADHCDPHSPYLRVSGTYARKMHIQMLSRRPSCVIREGVALLPLINTDSPRAFTSSLITGVP